MPVRRKVVKLYTPRAYRKSKRRIYRKSRINFRPKQQKVHLFKRTAVIECVVLDGGFQNATILGAYHSVGLNQVPGYTEFTAMYDMYKICGIKQKFVFNKTSAEVATTAEMPELITVNDYNDGSDLANEAEALEYASYKVSRLDKPRSRYYRPSINVPTQYSTNGLTTKSRWLNTSNPDIAHQGLKVAVNTIGTFGTTPLGILRVYYTYYLAFKGKK